MTRPYYWSVRRELWEYRSVWIAPIAVACIALLAFLVTSPGLPETVRDLSGPYMAKAHLAAHGPYGAAAMLGLATAFVVGFFYCLDALQGERRDRSILFWKSLPVSDRTTVLAKASIPLVVLPLLVFVLTVATYFVMILVSLAVLLGNRADIAILWANVQPIQSAVTVLYAVTIIALWHAPIYGWLMLVSGWARRTALLWAILPFVAIAGVERIIFGTSDFPRFLRYLVLGWVDRAFHFGADTSGMTPLLDALTPANLLATPSLWIGLAFTAACLVAAVRLRRYREPI